MATYIFGDIQGCYQPLQELLEKIDYSADRDRLGFAGDLINRGPQSLETLRFIYRIKNPIVVLGNHDLHLLALKQGVVQSTKDHALLEILHAPDADELLDWLRHQPLLHHDQEHNYTLVHAGIPPQWTINDAQNLANELQQQLRGEQYIDLLNHMYGNEPAAWNDSLANNDRARYIINAFTRMRFCDQNGTLDLNNKTATTTNSNLKPWYEWRQDEMDIFFGHWASLQGNCSNHKCIALDTGCVWGETLTAIRVEDRQTFSVSCAAK